MMDVQLGFSGGVSTAPDRSKSGNTVCEMVNVMPTQDGRAARRAGAAYLGPNTTPFASDQRTLEFQVDGKDYVLLYAYGQTYVEGSGSVPASAASVRCFEKATGARLTVTGTVPWSVALSKYTAAAQFGDYLLLASAGYPFDSQWYGTPGGNTAVHIKAGAFNTTYTVTVSSITASVTTPKAEHDEVLDTSGVPLFTLEGSGTADEKEPPYAKAINSDGTGPAIHFLTWGEWYHSGLAVYLLSAPAVPWVNTYPATPTTTGQCSFNPANPGAGIVFHSTAVNNTAGLVIAYTHEKVIPHPAYARRVQELQEAYDNRVAAHAAIAAAAVRPAAIADALASQLTTLGLSCTTVGAYILLGSAIVATVSDGEQNSLIAAHGKFNPVKVVEDLPPRHHIGGFVRSGSDDNAFGMIAVNKPGAAAPYGTFTDVVWEEYNKDGTYASWAGGVLFAKVHNGVLAVAETATAMEALTGTPHPALVRQTATINHAVLDLLDGEFPRSLNVLHERLIVSTKNFIAISTAGDPLRFDSLSSLTVAASDAFAVQAPGMEGDTLWGAAPFLGGLAFFGKGQYLLSGRAPISATGTTLLRLSNTSLSPEVAPCALGERLIAVRRTGGVAQFLQLSPGQYVDSAVESWLSSLQVEGGTISQLLWQPSGQHLIAVMRDTIWVLTMTRDQNNVVFSPWQITYAQSNPNATIYAAVLHNDGLIVFAGAAVWWQPLTPGSGADPNGVCPARVVFPQPYALDFNGRRRTSGNTRLILVDIGLEDSGHADLILPSGYAERLSPDTLTAIGTRDHIVSAYEDAGRITVSAVGADPLVITGVSARLDFTKRG